MKQIRIISSTYGSTRVLVDGKEYECEVHSYQSNTSLSIITDVYIKNEVCECGDVDCLKGS